MHPFPELIDRCTSFTLQALNEAHEKTIAALQTRAATSLVKTLQMVRLQKVISAVGMFAIFDAHLQCELRSEDGFKAAKAILQKQGAEELREQFSNLILAINVLKHGYGPSYKKLLEKTTILPFRIKKSDESFFNEGDVSEISPLIEVDDAFVTLCARTIEDVAEVVRTCLNQKQPNAKSLAPADDLSAA